MTAALVEVRDVTHRYGEAVVLEGISLEIAPAAYTILLGPSGSGKTTLLSVLGGFVEPWKGQVLIEGKDCTRVPPRQRPTTTVFQDYALFPHMTIEANVGFGLMMRGVRRHDRKERARAALSLVGLEGASGKRPHQLSGGQRQRVALARALVVEPAVLLLDEPLGALDLKLRRQMQDELKSIQSRVGTAFVHVTHDQEEAMALADCCVVMNRGRIEDIGSAERIYARPASRFTAAFMGDSTAIEGTVAEAKPGRAVVATALGHITIEAQEHAGAKLLLSLRPEHLQLGEPVRHLHLGEAVVETVTFQGSYKRVQANSTRNPVVRFEARIAVSQEISPGQSVSVSCDPANIIVTAR